MNSSASPAGRVTSSDLLELYRTMRRIRTFEERVSQLYRDGEIPGFVHVCIGQEASCAGVCWPLTDRDAITSTHRGHGHCLAKGLDPAPMMAELMGRATGTCGGLGGSMHIADPALGILGANGIVGAGIPIAVGAGTAARIRESDAVAVSFFGDGAVAQGAFHEAVGLAALWKLPVAFVCENNHFAEFSPESAQHAVSLGTRAAGYGLEHVLLDGSDVLTVAEAMHGVVEGLRAGGPPVVVEIDTYRSHGHYEGDPQRYRDVDGVKQQHAVADPLLHAQARLCADGILTDVIAQVDHEVRQEIEAAIEWARSQPEPDLASMHTSLYGTRISVREAPVDPAAEVFRQMDAVHEALTHEMEDDESVFIAGIDVAVGGNVFGLTRGLHERWPERVRDTPIAETSILGMAVGAAMSGLRPVVEIMYLDFIGVCFDQLLNQAAKLRFMTGGRCEIPITVRTQFGIGRSSGSQHSQSLEALLAHIPGLTVVMPSTPADTYGLLRASIQDPNPVVFIENRGLYGFKGPRPPRDHLVPIGKAAVVRPGSHLTLIAYSQGVHTAIAAAGQLAEAGIDAEVIDLRTIQPLDRATILESLERTSRLLVLQHAVTEFGVASEVARLASNEGFWYLDAPVSVVAPPFTPVPYAPPLERAWLPDVDDVVAEARRLVSR